MPFVVFSASQHKAKATSRPLHCVLAALVVTLMLAACMQLSPSRRAGAAQGCYAALLRPNDLSPGSSVASAINACLRQFSGLSTDADDVQVLPSHELPFIALSPYRHADLHVLVPSSALCLAYWSSNLRACDLRAGATCTLVVCV